jgi:hypothetical protein
MVTPLASHQAICPILVRSFCCVSSSKQYTGLALLFGSQIEEMAEGNLGMGPGGGEHWWTGLRWVWVPEGQEPLGFQVLPRRWVVERTFGWLGRNRRLSKDYEFLPETEEAFIYLGMVRLMLRRLAKTSRKGFSNTSNPTTIEYSIDIIMQFWSLQKKPPGRVDSGLWVRVNLWRRQSGTFTSR